MSPDHKIVSGIVKHYIYDLDQNPTIIGIQLASKELLLTEAGKTKYEIAHKPNEQRIAIDPPDNPTDNTIEMPTRFTSKTPATEGSAAICVLDSDGLTIVRNFLKSNNPQYILN